MLLQVIYEINCCAVRDKCIEAEEKILTFAAGREGDVYVDVTPFLFGMNHCFRMYTAHTQKEM
jgi:hypothetical protein